jgi:SAM-dependent methyltransferase
MNDYRTSHAYWSESHATSPELLGVAALGGCGLSEVIYRHHEELGHFSRLVPLTGSKSILELGCGNGRWIASLAARVGYYEAVDFSEFMLATARRRCADLGLANVRFVRASAQDYVPDRSFDIIYLSGLTQYLHDADLTQLLNRLLPHLVSGGLIIDRSTVHRRVRSVATQPGYFSIYRTAEDLIALFADAGLTNCYHARSYDFLNFSHPLRRLMSTRLAARFVTGAAPISFAILRIAARLRDAFCKPHGECLDYSHEFSVFLPKARI